MVNGIFEGLGEIYKKERRERRVVTLLPKYFYDQSVRNRSRVIPRSAPPLVYKDHTDKLGYFVRTVRWEKMAINLYNCHYLVLFFCSDH